MARSVSVAVARRKFPRSEFGERLNTMRLRRNLCATTLGELCGLSKNMIGRYERGEKAPSVDVLVALADFFDVSVDYLIGRSS